MDLLAKLEFLLALSRERHFGQAARACGVSQPTLSAGLRQLEEQLGVPLVKRTSRFQGLTDEGELVLGWARRLVADSRAMRQEIAALREGLTGRLRIGAIPTALAMVPALTTPFRAAHPRVDFAILSRNSNEILTQLEDLQLDAGLTYLDNERLGRVISVKLYREQYRLLTARGARFGDRDVVSWADIAQLPLCLLTPDMQNRRIIDRMLHAAGGASAPTLESNSMITLFAHVQTGRWASVMPSRMAQTLRLAETVRAIPIMMAEPAHTVGLVVADRDPMTPQVAALVRQAEILAAELALSPD